MNNNEDKLEECCATNQVAMPKINIQTMQWRPGGIMLDTFQHLENEYAENEYFENRDTACVAEIKADKHLNNGNDIIHKEDISP